YGRLQFCPVNASFRIEYGDPERDRSIRVRTSGEIHEAALEANANIGSIGNGHDIHTLWRGHIVRVRIDKVAKQLVTDNHARDLVESQLVKLNRLANIEGRGIGRRGDN